MPDGGLKFPVPSRGTAVVDGENRKSFACENLIEGRGNAFGNHLRCWSAVNVNDQRDLAADGCFRGQQQPSVESGSIVRLELEILRRPKTVFGDLIPRFPHR